MIFRCNGIILSKINFDNFLKLRVPSIIHDSYTVSIRFYFTLNIEEFYISKNEYIYIFFFNLIGQTFFITKPINFVLFLVKIIPAKW